MHVVNILPKYPKDMPSKVIKRDLIISCYIQNVGIMFKNIKNYKHKSCDICANLHNKIIENISKLLMDAVIVGADSYEIHKYFLIMERFGF